MGTMLGGRVLLARRDLGMKQEDLARLVGVSRAYISQIETGDVKGVMSDVLVKLSEALGVSVPYLLGLSEAPLAPDVDDSPLEANTDTLIYHFSDAQTRRMVQEMVSLLLDMTPRQRAFFFEMAQKLKDVVEESRSG